MEVQHLDVLSDFGTSRKGKAQLEPHSSATSFSNIYLNSAAKEFVFLWVKPVFDRLRISSIRIIWNHFQHRNTEHMSHQQEGPFPANPPRTPHPAAPSPTHCGKQGTYHSVVLRSINSHRGLCTCSNHIRERCLTSSAPLLTRGIAGGGSSAHTHKYYP